MIHIRTIIRKGLLTMSAVSVLVVTPILTLANASADATCTPPDPSSYGPGIHVPTGSEAVAYTYQCADSNNPDNPYVGDWLSAHYVFYPATATYQPLTPVVYTYNDTTGQYDYSIWQWDAATVSYQLINSSVTTPPAGADVVGGPPPVTPVASDPSDSSSPSTPTVPDGTVNAAGVNANQGITGGSNTASTNGTNNTTVGNVNNATVNTTLNGTATSGNALVIGNTNGGDATSGLTQDEANIVNMLQSSSNALGSGSNVVTFTDNINGNVNGDLILDPNMLGTVQPASNNTDSTNLNNNLTVNNSNGAAINNNITLSAVSGNATVANNTSGGNATSGNAEAIANLVNMIDSIVTAGRSFVGVVNVNGNLNGDILLPQNFVNEMIAANVPTVDITAPNSTNTSNTNVSNTTKVNNTNNEGINNAIVENATSGTAKVSDNTSAGNATSGTATTHLTAFNLTGSNVVGANDLLVFVNVLGKWVGTIVNAPPGATAAELGGGITSDSTTANSATNVTNTNNEQINNNVNVSAQSGNATVRSNTQAGNATSGNAATAVNALNVEHSSLSLSGWFGILFINVFGSWTGSFGINTPAGNSTVSVTPASPAVAASIISHDPVYGAYSVTTPTGGYGGGASGVNTAASSSGTSSSSSGNNTGGSLLAAKTIKHAAPTPALGAHPAEWKTFAVIGSMVVLYIVGDAVVTHSRRNARTRVSLS